MFILTSFIIDSDNIEFDNVEELIEYLMDMVDDGESMAGWLVQEWEQQELLVSLRADRWLAYQN